MTHLANPTVSPIGTVPSLFLFQKGRASRPVPRPGMVLFIAAFSRETSPPGPLSIFDGEGERVRAHRAENGRLPANPFACVPPLQLRWRGGQGVRSRSRTVS